MRIKVHVELITDWDESTTIEACEFVRPMKEFSAETVGLCLDDGKKLLQTVQQHVVAAQTWEMGELYQICPACHGKQRLKDYRNSPLDTVLGTVRFRSPRLICCSCRPPCFVEMSFCPFMSVIPERSTPELQRLQASLASEMSYRRAAEVLAQLLPIRSNHATIRNRTLRVGARLQAAGHCPAEVTEPGSAEVKKAEVTLTVDGGFVRSKPGVDSRNFEILVGRIVCPGERPYVFSWVRSEVASMPESLTDVLRAKTAAPMPEVSVITDGGNGVQHLHALVQLEHRVRKDQLETTVGLPASKRPVDAAVVNLRPPILVLGDGQFFPLTAEVQRQQHVVEQRVQPQLGRRTTPSLREVGADKFVELLQAEARRNPAPLLALRHFDRQKGRILVAPAVESKNQQRCRFQPVSTHFGNPQPVLHECA